MEDSVDHTSLLGVTSILGLGQDVTVGPVGTKANPEVECVVESDVVAAYNTLQHLHLFSPSLCK